MSDNKEDCRPDHVAAASYPKGGELSKREAAGLRK
jgi:hypothetical protein